MLGGYAAITYNNGTDRHVARTTTQQCVQFLKSCQAETVCLNLINQIVRQIPTQDQSTNVSQEIVPN